MNSLRALGYTTHEPVGQDGRRCQILAFIHQAEFTNYLSPGLVTVDEVEAGMIKWLTEHGGDTIIIAKKGDSGVLARICDAWVASEVEAIKERRRSAQGDHFTLPALLGWAYERTGRLASIVVMEGSKVVCTQYAPGHEDDEVEASLRLLYTGNHYLSVVPLARCAADLFESARVVCTP